MIKTAHFLEREKERGVKFKPKRIETIIPLTPEDAKKRERGETYDRLIVTDTCRVVARGKYLLTITPRHQPFSCRQKDRPTHFPH